MNRKDMQRSTWTRVREKQQIIRDFACGEKQGKISLLKILDLTAPMKRRLGGGPETVLADRGYYWLQLALDGSHAWYTVMFGPDGRLIQIYVDVTDGNDACRENPVFDDMYLDYVVSGGKVYELDRDELDAAFAGGAVTREQYGTALREGEGIFRFLTGNTAEIEAFFAGQFSLLRAELEG